MLRASNSLIGFVNFVTLLISLVILGGGIWLSTRANSTDCLRFLQWPIIIIGSAILVVSLAGFAGACYRISWLLRFYLTVMFFIIIALIGFTIFAFSVTAKGAGNPVLNRGYLEYRLGDYSGWLKDRVSDATYWDKIVSCIQQAGVCRKMAPGGIPETMDQFYARSLTPIQKLTQRFLLENGNKNKKVSEIELQTKNGSLSGKTRMWVETKTKRYLR